MAKWTYILSTVERIQFLKANPLLLSVQIEQKLYDRTFWRLSILLSLNYERNRLVSKSYISSQKNCLEAKWKRTVTKNRNKIIFQSSIQTQYFIFECRVDVRKIKFEFYFWKYYFKLQVLVLEKRSTQNNRIPVLL